MQILPCRKRSTVKCLAIVWMLGLSAGGCTLSKTRPSSPDGDGDGNRPFSVEAQTDAVPVSADVSTNMSDLTHDKGEPGEEEGESGSATAPAAAAAGEKTDAATAGANPAQGAAQASAADPQAKEKADAEGDAADDEKPPYRPGGFISYKVKRGDTLMKISFSLYADIFRWEEIYKLNRSKVPGGHELISPGIELKVYKPGHVVFQRNGDPYLIKRNDTLTKISDGLYGTTAKWRALWKNNDQLIRDPNLIYAGFYLYYLRERKKLALLSPDNTAPTPPAPPSSDKSLSDTEQRSVASVGETPTPTPTPPPAEAPVPPPPPAPTAPGPLQAPPPPEGGGR